MTGHIDYTESPSRGELEIPEEWLPVGARIREYLNTTARRSDLIITIGPGIGQGNPAFFQPSTAEIKIDSTVCLPGTAADDVHFTDALWRLEHHVFFGAVGHEAAHAAHTRWRPGDLLSAGATPRMMDTIFTLEEPRCESALIKRARGQKPFLRAAALDLILKDFTIPETPYGSATLAALVLGRVDGGTLEKSDGDAVTAAITAVLPDGLLTDLQQLWKEFLILGDSNVPGMWSVARRWLQLLNIDPKDPGTDGLVFPGHGNSSEDGNWIKQAVGSAAVRADGSIVKARANERTKRQMAADEADADRRQQAENKNKDVFHTPNPVAGAPSTSHLTGSRPATVAEKQAATELAALLAASEYRNIPDIGRVSRQSPPGRLKSRSAVQAAAYKDLGIRVRPEMFRGRERVPEGRTQLTIGTLADVSGSMSQSAAALASVQWVISTAGSRINARTASAHFGSSVYGVAPLGRVEERVQEYRCSDNSHRFADALLAIDHELTLIDGQGARLLVVATDAQWEAHQQTRAEALMTVLRRTGVHVLWLDLSGNKFYGAYGHGAVLDLYGAEPVEVARAVGTAAVRLMERQS